MSGNAKGRGPDSVTSSKQESQGHRARRVRVRAGTWLWGLAAAWTGIWLWSQEGGPDAVSSRSAVMSRRTDSRRVFPGLVDRDASMVTIELQGRDQPLLRLSPGSDGGHQVWKQKENLGPADRDAMDGVWASLRMATTLRAASVGQNLGIGQRGTIRISFSDHTASLELGHDTPDGSGVYAAFSEDPKSPWVVERELAWLVEQSPLTWLARRVTTIETESVSSLAWDSGQSIVRGVDGLWRIDQGDENFLLSSEAVKLKLDRLLTARLDPMLPREDIASEGMRPWLVLGTNDGRSQSLVLGKACPEHPERLVVDRGPGMLGCIDKELTAAWPFADRRAGFLESRLIPHDYGRVLTIEQRVPATRTLRRRSGGWYLDDEEGTHTVTEDEVYRWYKALAAIELESIDQEPPGFHPEIQLEIETDSTSVLLLECERRLRGSFCRRDGGSIHRVVGEMAVQLDFNVATFAERRLTDFVPEDVRAVEIRPGKKSGGVRQGIHRDLGVWKLDAPEHPDGRGALDEIRVEALLGALARLRAESWQKTGRRLPPIQRELRVELTPQSDGKNAIEVSLFQGCMVKVGELPVAKIASASCAAISDDLLYIDPLRHWLQSARSVEFRARGAEQSILLRPKQGRWLSEDGVFAPAEIESVLVSWEEWRSRGLFQDEGKRSVTEQDSASSNPNTGGKSRKRRHEWTAVIRRNEGPTVSLEGGADWVRLQGQNWFYQKTESVEKTRAVLGNEISDAEKDSPKLPAK